MLLVVTMFAMRGWGLYHAVNFRTFISEVEECMQKKVPAKLIIKKFNQVDEKFIQQMGNKEMIDFNFMCARLHKFVSPTNPGAKSIREKADEVVLRTDVSQEQVEHVSRFLWSCASLGIRPFLPEDIGDRLSSSEIPDKEYCTIIWALSKFANPDQPETYESFIKLVDSLSDERSKRLSDEDLVNLLRSISVVYNR
jgi:hypothetical protein